MSLLFTELLGYSKVAGVDIYESDFVQKVDIYLFEFMQYVPDELHKLKQIYVSQTKYQLYRDSLLSISGKKVSCSSTQH